MLPVLLADPLWWMAARLRRILIGLVVLALAVGATAGGGAALAALPAGSPLAGPASVTARQATVAELPPFGTPAARLSALDAPAPPGPAIDLDHRGHSGADADLSGTRVSGTRAFDARVPGTPVEAARTATSIGATSIGATSTGATSTGAVSTSATSTVDRPADAAPVTSSVLPDGATAGATPTAYARPYPAARPVPLGQRAPPAR